MKNSQTFQQKELLPLPDQVIEFITQRVQIEEEYARSLLKLNNRFENIQNNHTQCGSILLCFKAIHSERVHQISQFAEQIKNEKANFAEAVEKSHKQVQKSTNQLRTAERALKIIMQKVAKLKSKGQSQVKQSDEKFILKQLGYLGQQYKKKQVDESLKILDAQKQFQNKLRQQFQQLKKEGEKLGKKVKKHERIIHEQSPRIEFEIMEFLKKYIIEEISLIRNLQYDVDNMIKKTKIFDDSNSEDPSHKNKEGEKPFKSAHPLLKQSKQMFKVQFEIFDPYIEIKRKMALSCAAQAKKPTHSSEQSKKFEQAWPNKEQFHNLIHSLSEKSSQNLRMSAIDFIQSFRQKNIHKFKSEDFSSMLKLFKILMKESYQVRDLESIHRLIIYGSIYSCEETKECILDKIRKEPYLSDIYFWKFLLFFVILGVVSQCGHFENEREMHLRNNVFSALVSNSFNMIGSGIDKYQVRNTIAKVSRSFGLTESHVLDLLKFVDTGYQKIQKFKK